MKQVTQLYQTLQQKTFEKRYPDYSTTDDKVHVLYIGTAFNANGYYRHIVPAFELNQTDTHVAIINSLEKWDYNRQFGDFQDQPIDHQLVVWADYIVMPAMLTDAEYLFNALRQQNPNLQIVVDLDQNFHHIPGGHPIHQKVGTNEKDYLLKNIANTDILNVASEGLLYGYEKLIQEQHSKSIVYINYQPNLLSALAYEDSPPLMTNENSKTRIGLIGGLNAVADFKIILPALKAVSEAHQEEIELIFFGWNGVVEGQNILDGLEITFERSVSFTHYFDKLNGLSLDIVLLPLADHPFNTHGKSFIKFLEFAAMAIPAIASDLPPYNLVIEEEKNGLLADSNEEWLVHLKRLVNDKAYRRELGDNALKAAWYNHGCNWESQEALTRLFR